MINSDPFVTLVWQMRAAQRTYYKVRSAETLKAAKGLEAEVDRAIEASLVPRAEPTLFDRLPKGGG